MGFLIYEQKGSFFLPRGTGIEISLGARYNGCIFAYGQTGSGKSHSIMGDVEDEVPLWLPLSV